MSKILQQREPKAKDWSKAPFELYSKEQALLEQEEDGTILTVQRPRGFTWQYRLVEEKEAPARKVRISYLVTPPPDLPIEEVRRYVEDIARQEGVNLESVTEA